VERSKLTQESQRRLSGLDSSKVDYRGANTLQHTATHSQLETSREEQRRYSIYITYLTYIKIYITDIIYICYAKYNIFNIYNTSHTYNIYIIYPYSIYGSPLKPGEVGGPCLWRHSSRTQAAYTSTLRTHTLVAEGLIH
jgi:hypothetical protein